MLLAGSMPAPAGETQVAVIVSGRAPRVSFDQAMLRAIYLKKIFIGPDGRRLIPVNLPPGNPLRDAFSHVLIDMRDAQLQEYWNRQYFQGTSPPYVLGSQKAVVRFVAETPGAIGYVWPCHVDSSVRTVLLISLSAPATGQDPEACPANPQP
ncbi:MAG: hypothetical protein KGJ32_03855 [Xanthomonadaceae bacterium]|nr:hypothetical protein [Xanthomonadaceae bacterium]